MLCARVNFTPFMRDYLQQIVSVCEDTLLLRVRVRAFFSATCSHRHDVTVDMCQHFHYDS
jgi:hypothetical protein